MSHTADPGPAIPGAPQNGIASSYPAEPGCQAVRQSC